MDAVVAILFDDRGVFALAKPPGMISQEPKKGAKPGLCNLVQMHEPWGDAYTAHQIDRWTSGVMLAARTPQRRYLQKNWHAITQKVYLAIIKEPPWCEKTVDRPIDGKTAVTSFRVLQRSEGFALVRCELVQNGRTHQIRRHLKSLGYPIVGDQRYKGPETNARAGQLLHAWQIRVRLPNDELQPGSWVQIQAPIPEDFRSFPFEWEILEESSNAPLGYLRPPTG